MADYSKRKYMQVGGTINLSNTTYSSTFTIAADTTYRFTLNTQGITDAISIECYTTGSTDTCGFCLSNANYYGSGSWTGGNGMDDNSGDGNNFKFRIDYDYYNTQYYLYVQGATASTTGRTTLYVKRCTPTYNFVDKGSLSSITNGYTQTLNYVGKTIYRYTIPSNTITSLISILSDHSSDFKMWINYNEKDYNLYDYYGTRYTNGSQQVEYSTSSSTYYLFISTQESNTTSQSVQFVFRYKYWTLTKRNSTYYNYPSSEKLIDSNFTNEDNHYLNINISSGYIYRYALRRYNNGTTYYYSPLEITGNNNNVNIWLSTSDSAYDVTVNTSGYTQSENCWINTGSNGDIIIQENQDETQSYDKYYYLYIALKNTNITTTQSITLYIKQKFFIVSPIEELTINKSNNIIKTITNQEQRYIYRYKLNIQSTNNYQIKFANTVNNYWISTQADDYNLYLTAGTNNNNLYTSLTSIINLNAGTYYLYFTFNTSTSITMSIIPQRWEYIDLNEQINITTPPMKSLNFNISPGVIYHLAFKISSSSYYTPLSVYSISPNGANPDLVGWICSTNSASNYELYQTENSMSLGTYSDDNSNGNNQFRIDLGSINDTSYRHLYFSSKAYNTSFQNNTLITIKIKNPSLPDAWVFQSKGNINLSDNQSITTTFASRTIYRYEINVLNYKNYKFQLGNSTSNYSSGFAAWISESSNAYNQDQFENSSNYCELGDTFKGTPTISTQLLKNHTYYFYYSGTDLMDTDNENNFVITITSTSISPALSSVNTGSQISAANFYNKLTTAWQTLCSKRNHYGNISSRSNQLPAVSAGAIAVPDTINDRIAEFNDYFTDSIISVINKNDYFDKDVANNIYSYFSNAGKNEGAPGAISCKTACTGYCTSTNSHKPNSSEYYSCNTCDTSCSGCSGTCSSNCQSGCTGGCSNSCAIGYQGETGEQIGTQTISNCSECAATCTKTCENTCNNYCGTNCVGDCNTTCKSMCGGCGYCTGSCTNTCTGTCGECAGNCSGWSTNPYLCGSNCAGNCESICGSTCGGWCGASCSESCTYSCEDTCNDGCYSSCTGECHSCTNACGNTCSGCTNSCAKNSAGTVTTTNCNGCVSGCSSGCKDQCGSGCTSGCQGNCYIGCTGCTGCDGGCARSCASKTQGSITTSYGDCHENCTHNCATSCTNTCILENYS